jgi:hypothetical protein
MAEQRLTEIPITEADFEQLLQFAKASDKTIAEVVSDLLREHEYRELLRKSAIAMGEMQAEAQRNGTCNMTLDEINEEIEAARRDMALAKSA